MTTTTESDTNPSTGAEPPLDDVRQRLHRAYRNNHHDEVVDDLAQYHDAATTYLALLDSHAPDELPDDLDPETQDRLETVATELPKVISELEQTAQQRLSEQEQEE